MVNDKVTFFCVGGRLGQVGLCLDIKHDSFGVMPRQVPRQHEEFFAKGRTKRDFATVAGLTNQLVGLLNFCIHKGVRFQQKPLVRVRVITQFVPSQRNCLALLRIALQILPDDIEGGWYLFVSKNFQDAIAVWTGRIIKGQRDNFLIRFYAGDNLTKKLKRSGFTGQV